MQCMCSRSVWLAPGTSNGWISKRSMSVTNSYELMCISFDWMQFCFGFYFAHFRRCRTYVVCLRCTWIFVINEKSRSLPFAACECVIGHLIHNSACTNDDSHHTTTTNKWIQCRNTQWWTLYIHSSYFRKAKWSASLTSVDAEQNIVVNLFVFAFMSCNFAFLFISLRLTLYVWLQFLSSLFMIHNNDYYALNFE